jgi:hypothetical protein
MHELRIGKNLEGRGDLLFRLDALRKNTKKLQLGFPVSRLRYEPSVYVDKSRASPLSQSVPLYSA